MVEFIKLLTNKLSAKRIPIEPVALAIVEMAIGPPMNSDIMSTLVALCVTTTERMICHDAAKFNTMTI